MNAGKILALALMFASAAPAHAQFSSTIALVSDYDFRGVSISATDPALQGSLDYAFANGLWIGAWASNFDYGLEYDGNVALDYYAGYTGEISETLSWSAGVLVDTYPDSNDPIEVEPYAEGYVDVSAGGFHAAQFYAHDYGGAGAAALYTEANYTWSLPKNFGLHVHAGYSWGDYFEDDALGGGEIADYGMALSFAAGNFTLKGKVVGTDASGDRRVTDGPFANDTRFIFSVETMFPWSNGN
jgi:uncharacterized protein (TIGR02001 family)